MQCESAEELAEHSLVYFIDSMLQVDELDLARKLTVSMREAVTSTNVFVHIEATRAGAGIGLLPLLHGRAARRSDSRAAGSHRSQTFVLVGGSF